MYREQWEQLANGTCLSIRHGNLRWYDGIKNTTTKSKPSLTFYLRKIFTCNFACWFAYHLVRVWDCRVQYRRDHCSPATSTMESMTGRGREAPPRRDNEERLQQGYNYVSRKKKKKKRSSAHPLGLQRRAFKKNNRRGVRVQARQAGCITCYLLKQKLPR